MFDPSSFKKVIVTPDGTIKIIYGDKVVIDNGKGPPIIKNISKETHELFDGLSDSCNKFSHNRIYRSL